MRKLARLWGGLAVAFAAGLGLVMVGLAWPAPWQAQEQIQGVTFAWPHARGIGLDWRETYRAVLDDLNVRHIRLSAYWNELEPTPDRFEFEPLDWQLNEADQRQAEVVLAIGRKVPRWPECHVPDWAKDLDESGQQKQVLELLEELVRRYDNHPAVTAWQLENEPLLDFGVCPEFDRNFYEAELALVKSLSTKPVVVTDSGELNWWLDVSQYGDMVGTTMYRTVHSQRTNKLFHYDYIFPAWLYRAKARVVKILRGKDVFVAELQGEPWAAVPFTEVPDEEREENLPVKRLQEIHNFSRRTQLPAAYWWGVEFWYWEKEVKGNSGYWDAAKEFFNAA